MTESPAGDAAARADRARQIVATLTTADKIRLLSGDGPWHTEGLPDHGLGRGMLTDGPHGVRKQAAIEGAEISLADSVPATCFPTASALAATWNPALVERVGQALGRESAAEGVGVLLGPGLNIKRHPAGGRNFEYFSEDPRLSGAMAAALTRGIQSQGVGACLKHFAVNNHEAHRTRVDVIVDERTLREIYLAGFEIAVKESQPWTVMCSYNQVNGTHAAEHSELLTDILRDEWGFDGLVMSDWYAVADRAAGVAAGLDLEMPGSQGTWDGRVAAALDKGALSPAALDQAATRVVDLLLRMDEGTAGSDAEPVDTDAMHASHHDLARTVAAEAAVLLTNDGTLPLPERADLAVIGAFAEEPRYQGAGSSLMNPTRLDALLPHLREAYGDHHVAYAPGYNAATGEASDAQIAAAVEVAREADIAIVVVGLPGSYESEGYDRESLSLPPGHDALVRAVCDANERTVVVLCNGAPVTLPWADRPAAILEAYLGGQAGGTALLDVLTGEAEPGGRLAESFPVAARQLASDAHFPGGVTQSQYREGLHVGYRFHDTAGVPARFAFGHGLGYTDFEIAEPVISGEGTDVTVSVQVRNTGKRAGSAVVQVYLAPPQRSAVPRVAQELVGFAKITLSALDSGSVFIDVDRRSFAVWDVGAHDWAVEAGDYEIRVGLSSVDIHHTVTHRIRTGDDLAIVEPPAGPVASDDEFARLLGRDIPAPAPMLPFTYDSELRDLSMTWLGRRVLAIILRQAVGTMGGNAEEGETDPTQDAFLWSTPMRTLAMASEGRLSLRQVDLILLTLNVFAGPKAWRRRR